MLWSRIRNISPEFLVGVFWVLIFLVYFPDSLMKWALFTITAVYFLRKAPKWIFELRMKNTIKVQGILGQSLLNRRIVFLDGKMNQKRCSKAFLEISYLNMQSAEPIYLYINSSGGDFEAMKLLANGITSSGSRVIGIVVGRAFSAAALLLQVCAERRALPYASLFFHEGHVSQESFAMKSGTQEGLLDAINKLTTLSSRLREDNDFIATIVVTPSGLSTERLKTVYDKILSAQEALELGLIDGIITNL